MRLDGYSQQLDLRYLAMDFVTSLLYLYRYNLTYAMCGWLLENAYEIICQPIFIPIETANFFFKGISPSS